MNHGGYGEEEVNRQGRQERQEEADISVVRAQSAEGGMAEVENRRGRHVAEPDADTDRVAQAVIGAATEVHRALGPGFLESVYEQAMSIELGLLGISFERQVPVAVSYKGHSIGESRLDLLVEAMLIVELKAVDQLAAIHTAQVMSYLKATGHRLGLLINFNVVRLKDGVRRVVLS
jgi:GxxExxY protein